MGRVVAPVFDGSDIEQTTKVNNINGGGGGE